MKTTQYIIALLAGMAALSCVKEAGKELPQPQDLITIKAQMPEDVLTKAGAHVGFSWYWGEGDKIAITGAEDTQIYNIQDGFTPKYAEFVGKPVAGDAFTITYPEKAASADWSGQTQTGNNSIDHLKYAAELAGVDDYLSFTFDADWAAAHNGTLKQVGVMKMVIALPDTVTAVNGVSIAAENAIFFKGNGETKVNKLDLAVEKAAPDANHTFVAWFTTSWHEAIVPANTVLTVSVKTAGNPISKDVTFTKESVLKSGVVNVFNLDNTGWSLPSHYASGKGTADDPWIIMTADQMKYMADDMLSGETRYFKLGANIDLNGIEWAPLNNVSPYDSGVDFDGAGYTVKNLTITTEGVAYPSFAGVLYGSIKNVTFDSANIDGMGNNTGVVAGYIGTGDYAGTCSGVTVSNATVQASNKNVGAFAGVIAAAQTITDCHVTGNTTVKQTATATGSCAGGFAGSASVAVAFNNCTATANVTNEASYYTGGFIGQLSAAVKAQFVSCAYLGGTITAGRDAATNSPVGGFIGRIPKNSAATFTDCHVEGATISAPKSGRVGGFAGDAGDKNTIFTSCYVKNSALTAAQHLGGFAGTYGSGTKCYVESTTITAGNANTGGFAGYPEKSVYSDCYVASDVTVVGGTFNSVGGFMGICKVEAIITNCFSAATVSGTGTGVGAFIGFVDAAPSSITKCIGWNASLAFFGGAKDGVDTSAITGNYAGTEGTITAKAIEFGWSADIWDFSGDTPKFK